MRMHEGLLTLLPRRRAISLSRRAVLFVCTANICRSPMAEAVFARMSRRLRLGVDIDSAGTHDYHEHMPPFPMAVATAKRRGYDLTRLVARRVRPHDFDYFDLIVAMDRENLADLRAMAPKRALPKLRRLLDYGHVHWGRNVPDPYGRGPDRFDMTLDMIEDGCLGLARALRHELAARERCNTRLS
jgi:protein-tyrosine phosphatase